MRWFDNMKIASKLIIGFIFVALIGGFIGLFGMVNLHNLNDQDTRLYEEGTLPMGLIGEIQGQFLRIRIHMRDIVTHEAVEKPRLADSIRTLRGETEKNFAAYEKQIASEEEKREFTALKGEIGRYWPITEQLIQYSLNNQPDQANALLRGEGARVGKAVDDVLAKLYQIKIQQAKTISDSNTALANRTTVVTIGVLVLAMLLAIGLGYVIARAISRPIRQIVAVADKIANGDLQVSVDNHSTDEVGQLAHAFGKIIVALRNMTADTDMLVQSALDGRLAIRADAGKHSGDYRKIIEGVNKTLDAVVEPVKEARDVLKEMANGNLQKRMQGEYRGDHAEMKLAMNSTLDALSSYVGEISAVLTEVSNCNLHVQIHNDYKGDFIQIKTAMNATINELSKYIGEVAHVLTEMADANLDVGIEQEYKGDFLQIKEALNLIIATFNEVFCEIIGAADEVASGSQQVAEGSQTLSQGATEQASSIEQLTVSTGQVASQTKDNALNANRASELAMQARENAESGNEHMREMLISMADINDSSASINKIIKVIDEIAFQTNILALNAAVEAARAGQHGKGFAVVAEEVRNLAARSANAAKETTALIEGSMKKVESGTEIANSTARALNEIVEGIAKAAHLVGEIATDSNEQATAITQISRGIEQVSQVVQTNSATAEESAAASEELSSQAKHLKEMVGKFRLRRSSQRLAHYDIAESSSRKNRVGRGMAAAVTVKRPKIVLSDKEFGKY